MTSFRFIHASDIHLDSPLTGLGGTEGNAIDRIRAAPRAAFEALVDHVISDEIDFLVIAGDLYDGSWRDFRTGLFFADQMGKLNQAGVPVFVLHGNHDAQSQITRPLKLPENVKVFNARKPETIYLKDYDVALHGQSYRERAVTSNLVPEYPEPMDNLFNIGVLHTALGGAPLHDNYAPCTIQELVAKGYDYWALGHVHRREILNKEPYVVFCGNIQGRHIRETGPKGASLVTVESGEVTQIEALTFDVVRWSLINVDVKSAHDMLGVINLIQSALENQVAKADGRLLAARVVLQGKTDLHNELLADLEHLTADIQSIALGLGDEVAWIERLLIQTEPATDLSELAAREDALGDLQQMLTKARADDDLVQEIAAHAGVLISRLPSVIRENCEDPLLRAVVNHDYDALIEHVTPYLIARLLAEGSKPCA